MTKIELVFVPTPITGHLLSMVEFAKLVVQTNPNISIIILVYHIEQNEPTKVNSYVESQSRELDPTQIQFITLPPLSNPPGPSTDPAFVKSIIQLQNPLLKKAVQDRQFKPVAFVLDLVNVSMIDIANELRIPSYVYFTGGANQLATMFHFQEIVDEHGSDAVTGLIDNPDSEVGLPWFTNPVPVTVLPWSLFDKESVWGVGLVFELARRFRESKGILVNSFMELESCTIQFLQNRENVPTIFPIGPVLSFENRGHSKPSDNDDDNEMNDEASVISWLDEQPKSSVVFLCFGSMGAFNMDQVKEIADGLDRSGHRFLWSLRKPVQVGSLGVVPSEKIIFEDALPVGFMDRTAHKGKIIAWAPQVAVLAHEAIGGFVSHCGWNSTLESIWFGVPLATWPMYSEQQLNAFTLVKELGLAVEIKLDYRWDKKKQESNYLVTAEEVEVGVRKLMSIDQEMKGKVRKMSEVSRNVLQIETGSSRGSLNRFIAELTQNVI